MSDKQTTGVILLVILALVFWLYNEGKLGNVVNLITGSTGSPTNIASVSSNLVPSATSSANYSTASGGLTSNVQTLNSLYSINQGNNVFTYAQQNTGGSDSVQQAASTGAVFASLTSALA